uniref:Uncharacterized protein n=1 Tax=Anguilla anguilla TaxID=7936 RepID=A0A0E9TC09_ANGAN
MVHTKSNTKQAQQLYMHWSLIYILFRVCIEAVTIQPYFETTVRSSAQ